MKCRRHVISAVFFCVGTAFLTCSASAMDEGEKLYTQFQCSHCHGQDGKKPASDVIPTIGGKSADFIRKEAADILSGARTGRATVMHAKYYSSEATGSACDVGPKSEELDKIATWLAAR